MRTTRPARSSSAAPQKAARVLETPFAKKVYAIVARIPKGKTMTYKDVPSFNAKLDFEMTLISHQGKTDWVEPTLFALKECADSQEIPQAAADCDYCRYREAAGKALLEQKKKTRAPDAPDIPAPAPVKSKKIAYEDNPTSSLF